MMPVLPPAGRGGRGRARTLLSRCRCSRRRPRTPNARSDEGRLTENLVAVAMFADYPVTRRGARSSFPVTTATTRRDIGNDPRPEREAHSLPLEIAAEQGLAGVIGWHVAFLTVFRFAYARGVWNLLIGRTVMLSIVTYMIASLFLHGARSACCACCSACCSRWAGRAPTRTTAGVARLSARAACFWGSARRRRLGAGRLSRWRCCCCRERRWRSGRRQPAGEPCSSPPIASARRCATSCARCRSSTIRPTG